MSRLLLSRVTVGLLLFSAAALSQQQSPVNQLEKLGSKQQAKSHLFTKTALTLTADPPSVQPKQTVTVTGTWNRKVPAYTYRFDWNDGGQPEDKQVPTASHSYELPKTYTVRVTATPLITTAVAWIPPITSEVVINVVPPPPENPGGSQEALPFTVTGSLLPPEGSRTVRATISWDPRMHVEKCTLDWGDQTASQECTEGDTDHTYSVANGYTIRAEVTGYANDSNFDQTSEFPITIPETTTPEPVPPQPEVKSSLHVGIGSTQLMPGKDIVFHASLEPPQQAARYVFEWGDSSPPYEANWNGDAVHRYVTAGRKTVAVTAYWEGQGHQRLQKILPLSLATPFWNWPFGLLQWLLVILGVAAVVWTGTKLFPTQPTSAELHVRGFSGTSVHKIAHIHSSGPNASLMLKPGAGVAEHNVVFPKSASASK